ncbi:TetR/AcrR family transcriptional regulator [Acidaminobacter sp. JC074]|uniref:TetR/AcrR family transcriptional regulator n=1 Tax=Acidaminobacter sp. JC074 TaxID=2530199 RepID=UPI001F0DB7CE|nr:TetR/AcrR family transcriptional regulator [Acidaminobacter sp. JC074]MCH4890002.1 TetR/AcrR family transcriptional regulator [Acidaminobacter sp. JC074]
MDNYHHGDLKKALVEEGLILLNQYGLEGFSLRKVAAKCQVSHTAPYKHFKNKEELIAAISHHVKTSFAHALDQARSRHENIENKMVAVGVNYVMFMVNNPDYYRFLFSNKYDCKVEIKTGMIEYYDDPVFHVFYETAVDFFDFYRLPKETYIKNIIAMWAMVQGLSSLFSGTMTTEEDLEGLVVEMLTQKLKFI